MSDWEAQTRRLRVAADALERYWGGDVTYAAAALLRAVADAHARQEGEQDDGPCCCAEVTTALAVADAILGGE